MLFVFELSDSLLHTRNGMSSMVQMQKAVTADLSSKQLLLFDLELQDSLLSSRNGTFYVQRQTAVTAFLSNQQFVFAMQRQTAVTADLSS